MQSENVWEYPRPPRLEAVPERVTIEFNGEVIADTNAAYRVLETSHPPTYYLPPADLAMEHIEPAGGRSLCEWKGSAQYVTVRVGERVAERVGWRYPRPTPAFAAIKDHIAFYAGPMDRCTVGGVEVTPQPGGFYGGWVTPNLTGPFKGGPGTMGW
ncbi:MAG: DUF427 domain-containing protein [Bacteroidota bacterium]